MNIFILSDKGPQDNARQHCDKHVVKMVLETAQMLCGAHQFYGSPQPYTMSAGHMKHPCSLWAQHSLQNYDYLYELGLELGDEYTLRYGKRHRSSEVIENLPYPRNLVPSRGRSPFACAFKKGAGFEEKLKELAKESVVEAYQWYYVYDKSSFAKWKTRGEPAWFTEKLAIANELKLLA